jgi:hypothetical protein
MYKKEIYNKFDWDKFKEYVDTYDPDKHAASNPDIILEDMLYGLGTSLKPKEYKMSNGYKNFKQDLIDFIKEKTL